MTAPSRPRRGLVVTAVVSLVAAVTAPAALAGQPGSRPAAASGAVTGAANATPTRGSAVAPSARSALSAGPVTAHDGHFWRNGVPIILRGINIETNQPFGRADAVRIAAAGLNVIRLRIHWSKLEPNPPVRQANGTWVHTYSSTAMQRIKTDVATAWAQGIYTILDNHNCSCNFFLFPDWSATSRYNSTHQTYPRTTDGLWQFRTDFWSDSLRLQFMASVMHYVAAQAAGLPGVLGYEVLNEPHSGFLPNDAQTTRLVMTDQLPIAQAIRAADPARIIFFETRFGYGPGLHSVDLSAWQAMGNMAFDLHDGFGARWGVGVQLDPASPEYQNGPQYINNNITLTGVPPYGGNTADQARILLDRLQSVNRWGFPLFLGEFGDDNTDSGVMLNWGTILGALCYVGGANVSWAVRDYKGAKGLWKPDGTPWPWTSMVEAQAANPC